MTEKNARGEMEDWQLEEIRAGLRDLDEGEHVAHEEVAAWMRCWGTQAEEVMACELKRE